MRKRTIHINIRTTQNEKEIYENNAKSCGLSLSEYLRKLANGYQPKPLPPLEYYRLISVLNDIYNEIKKYNFPNLEQKLLEIIMQIQTAIFMDECA